MLNASSTRSLLSILLAIAMSAGVPARVLADQGVVNGLWHAATQAEAAAHCGTDEVIQYATYLYEKDENFALVYISKSSASGASRFGDRSLPQIYGCRSEADRNHYSELSAYLAGQPVTHAPPPAPVTFAEYTTESAAHAVCDSIGQEVVFLDDFASSSNNFGAATPKYYIRKGETFYGTGSRNNTGSYGCVKLAEAHGYTHEGTTVAIQDAAFQNAYCAAHPTEGGCFKDWSNGQPHATVLDVATHVTYAIGWHDLTVQDATGFISFRDPAHGNTIVLQRGTLNISPSEGWALPLNGDQVRTALALSSTGGQSRSWNGGGVQNAPPMPAGSGSGQTIALGLGERFITLNGTPYIASNFQATADGLSFTGKLLTVSNGIIGVGSGNIIGVGSGNIIGVGSGNIIGVGSGNIIGVGSGNLINLTGSSFADQLRSANLIGKSVGTIIGVGSGNIIGVGSGNIIGVGSGNLMGSGLTQYSPTMRHAQSLGATFVYSSAAVAARFCAQQDVVFALRDHLYAASAEQSLVLGYGCKANLEAGGYRKAP